MIRGILTLMMLIAAYSIASFNEEITAPSDIELKVSHDFFEGTVVDVHGKESSIYSLIHLRSGDLEWAIKYYDNDMNYDSKLMSLLQIVTAKAQIRVELDCTPSFPPYTSDITVNQGRLVWYIHINPNENMPCQIISSRLL